jgi:hypothetical protein
VNALRRLALTAPVVCAALLMPLTASAATSTWQVMPAQANATADYLNAVACPAASFCLALGSSGPIPLDFGWNGTTWSQAPPVGEPEESEINAISCASATFCVAVGYNFLGHKYGDQAAAWAWNGSTWADMVMSSPAKWEQLNAVKCLSISDCEAVGSQSAHLNYGSHALAEVWNGSTWSMQPVLGRRGTVEGRLNAVACQSGGGCEALGSRENDTRVWLAVRWNGTRWSPQKLPAVTGSPGLAGVSCYRSGCTAVGSIVNTSGQQQTIAEKWNGSRWALQSPVGSGDVSGAAATSWNAVHCWSATRCTVVGSWQDTAENSYTLAERWNGRAWIQDTTPSPTSGGTASDTLYGLSCAPGTRVCTAVGYGGSSLVFAIRN